MKVGWGRSTLFPLPLFPPTFLGLINVATEVGRSRHARTAQLSSDIAVGERVGWTGGGAVGRTAILGSGPL